MTSKFDISLKPPSGFVPAMTEFSGVFGGATKDVRTGKRPPYNTYEMVLLQFGDLEVIETTSPVDDSDFTLEIFYSEERDNTPFEAFRKSLVVFLPDEANGDINWLIGRRWTMKFDNASLSIKDDATGKWSVQTGKAWQITAIEGLVNTATSDGEGINNYIATSIANGNTESEALQVFYADESIRSMPGYSDAMNAATNGNLFSGLVDDGLLTIDDEEKYVG